MSRNRAARRTQKRKAIRLDLLTAQQYLEQQVHVQIADLVLNICVRISRICRLNLATMGFVIPCPSTSLISNGSLLPISCGAINDFALRTELRSNDSAPNLAWHMGVILA
jgi:hypothetical protein